MKNYYFISSTNVGNYTAKVQTELSSGTVKLVHNGATLADNLPVDSNGLVEVTISKSLLTHGENTLFTLETANQVVVEIKGYLEEADVELDDGTPDYRLDGVPLWVYGSSFTVDPAFAATPGQEFHKLTASRLGMTATTFGSSGKSIRDAAKRIVGGLGVANAAWPTTRKGVAIIDTWVNDLSAYGAGPVPRAYVAKDINGIKKNLAAALAVISAGTTLENTVGTKAGTWLADGAANDRSGGSNSITSTAGSTMTFTNANVPEDHFFFLSHVLEPNSFQLSRVEVLVDGVVVRTIEATEFHGHSLVEGTTSTTGSAAFKISTTPGVHTVVFRHAGTTGQNMLVDALIVPKPVAKRNPIFVIQDALPRGVVGGAFYKPEQIPVLQNNWSQLLAAYQEVLAQFPNAVFVETTLNATTDYGADGLHPNDRGMARKADELTDAIREYLVDNRPDSLYAVV